MIYGLILGVLLAVFDHLLMYILFKKAAKLPQKASFMVSIGTAIRYLLVAAVLFVSLLVPSIDSLWVVIPIVIQKVIELFLMFSSNKK